MDGIIDNLNFLDEIFAVKEKLDENQINKLEEIRNSIRGEFQKYYSPLDTIIYYIDQLFEVNERNNSFRERRELTTQLKFNILIIAIWRTLMDEDLL